MEVNAECVGLHVVFMREKLSLERVSKRNALQPLRLKGVDLFAYHVGLKARETLSALRRDALPKIAGREEDALALLEREDIAFSVFNGGLAFVGNEDDKRVGADSVGFDWLCELEKTGGELRAVDKHHSFVVHRFVVGAVVGASAVVERFAGLLHMEFALLSVGIDAVEVVDAEGVVARLLNLNKEVAGADAMDAAGRNKETVAGLSSTAVEVFSQRTVGQALGVSLSREFMVETGAERSVRGGLDDVPHLGLSVGVAHTLRHGIVGVNLDAEVAVGRDELDEQGESVAVALQIFLSHKVCSIALNELLKCEAGMVAVYNNSFVARNTGNLPALADAQEICYVFNVCHFFTRPDGRFQNGLEFQSFHKSEDFYMWWRIYEKKAVPLPYGRRNGTFCSCA